jgi:hypothetical protein
LRKAIRWRGKRKRHNAETEQDAAPLKHKNLAE